MADNCYDVWLPNARGNYYSRRHIKLKPSDRAFWNFSWCEIGLNDYPAVFKYALKLTNNTQVNVVAHSQGTTSLMCLMEKKIYNYLLKCVTLMAPVSWLNESALPLQLLADLLPAFEVTEHFINTDLI